MVYSLKWHLYLASFNKKNKFNGKKINILLKDLNLKKKYETNCGINKEIDKKRKNIVKQKILKKNKSLFCTLALKNMKNMKKMQIKKLKTPKENSRTK